MFDCFVTLFGSSVCWHEDCVDCDEGCDAGSYPPSPTWPWYLFGITAVEHHEMYQ